MLRTSTRSLQGISVAVVVAAALAGCSGPAYTSQGVKIGGLEEVITALEIAMRSTDEQIAIAKDAACYLEALPDGTDLTGRGFCGPVLHQFGDQDRFFDVYALEVVPVAADEFTVVMGSSSPVAFGQPAPTSTTLIRPDGRTAPLSTDLTVPPPPVLGAGQLLDLTAETGLTIDQYPDPVPLRTYGATFTVDGYTFTDQVGTGIDARSAGDGRQILVLQYAYDRTAGEDPDPVFTVTAGGERVTWNPGPLPAPRTWVAVNVPADPDQVTVEMTHLGFTQTVDVTGATRTGQEITVLYRDRVTVDEDNNPGLALALSEQANLTYSWKSIFGVGQYDAQLTVTSAQLVYWLTPTQVASSPDQALLRLKGTFTNDSIHNMEIPADRFTLTGDDGTTYTGQSLPISPYGYAVHDNIFFEVPATFTGGTITFTPGVVAEYSSTETHDFAQETLTFPVTFP
jgi:hypothetical protein